MTLIVTAYCACKLCCGPHAAGITASGVRPVQGTTIAASRSIPFGTRLSVGGQVFTVQDRLAKRYDSRVDIFMWSHAEAKAFGKRRLTVKKL